MVSIIISFLYMGETAQSHNYYVVELDYRLKSNYFEDNKPASLIAVETISDTKMVK